MNNETQWVDVLIVGAGLTGIGLARHLQRECPQDSFALLESRSAIGGTWDLFRYPGIRSDSDMYTFSYGSKPWLAKQSLGDGARIRNYITEAAAEAGVDKHIRFQQRCSAPVGHQTRPAGRLRPYEQIPTRPFVLAVIF